MAVTIAVVLLATAVGIGVHVLYKEARAATSYTVDITDDGDPVVVMLNVTVFWEDEFGLDIDEVGMIHTGNGQYKGETELTQSQFTTWRVHIGDEDIVAIEPPTNPALQSNTITHFDWDVEDNR